jgi:hypothetical protein
MAMNLRNDSEVLHNHMRGERRGILGIRPMDVCIYYVLHGNTLRKSLSWRKEITLPSRANP